MHMYLKLVYNGQAAKAIALMLCFAFELNIYYQKYLRKLAMVPERDHMKGYELTDTSSLTSLYCDVKGNAVVVKETLA